MPIDEGLPGAGCARDSRRDRGCELRIRAGGFESWTVLCRSMVAMGGFYQL